MTEKILEKIDENIYMEIDGFYVFNTSKGYLTSYYLRLIADELDKRNEEWQNTINKLYE